MTSKRTYSDEQLVAAIDRSVSWRDLMRGLGLVSTSSGSMRPARARADALGNNYTHFHGQRRWSDSRIRSAVLGSDSYAEVAEKLGLVGAHARSVMVRHALRLGLGLAHLESAAPVATTESMTPTFARLKRAGPMLAAVWFTLRKFDVSWPLEPCRYDLLATRAREPQRVQVKTTRAKEAGPGRSICRYQGPSAGSTNLTRAMSSSWSTGT